jgi:two-component system sensor histidine kinase YesM
MRGILFFRKSIQTKILLSFISVSLIPLALLGWMSYKWYVDRVENRTAEYNAELIRTFTNDMDQFLQQIELFSFTAYQDNFQALWKDGLQAKSFGKIRNELAMDELFQRQEEFYNFRGIIRSVTLLDAEGLVFYENKMTVKSEYQFEKEEWFSPLKNGIRSSYLIGPYRSQPWLPSDLLPSEAIGADSYSLTYIRKVSDLEQTQTVLGYILLHFSLKEVQKFLDPLMRDSSGKMIIADRQGRIVYDPDSSQIGQSISPEMRVNADDRKYTVVREDDRRYLVTSTSLSTVDWDIYSKNDLDELLSDSKEMRNLTILFVAGSFALALLSAHVLSVGLVTPIKRLKNGMLKVSQGYLGGMQADKLPRDEIGELGRYFNEMIGRIKYLIEQVYQAELHEKEAKLNALQAQINPHFLYNTLETINSIAAVEGVSKVSDIASALSDMFRYSTKAGGMTVIVAEEIRHIRNYLEIVSIRFEDKLSVYLDIPEELNRYRMIKLVLQPIVENAVFHGIETIRGKGELHISARKENDELVFSIRDNGTGMTSEQLVLLRKGLADPAVHEPNEPAEGKVGIKNVHDRIRFYYGDAYGISLESKPGELTEVTIRIPAQS